MSTNSGASPAVNTATSRRSQSSDGKQAASKTSAGSTREQHDEDDRGDMSTMYSTIKTRDTATYDQSQYANVSTARDTNPPSTISAYASVEAMNKAGISLSRVGQTTVGLATAGLASKGPTSVADTASTPRTQSLDLRTNDNQFHVIASLIVDKFERALNSGAPSFKVTAVDKMQIDRTVPERVRQNFVEAVQLRLQACPVQPTRPIHVVLRKCEAIGLDREGSQNPLFAAEGTVIQVTGKGVVDDASVAQSTEESPEEALARKQLLAELREASNLMAESVTPEAAQFWRKHVVELQARLRSLHEKNGVSRVTGEAEEIMRNNERLLASLQENTGYVPPRQDEFQQVRSRGTIGASQSAQHEVDQGDIGDPSTERMPMVDVVAPGDLPGGYTFEAEIGGRRFLATVPAGGVGRGETFSSIMRAVDPENAEIPSGRWRDSCFAFFKFGPCHPLVLNAVFCPLIALAQIMTRLGFDFLGQPNPNVPKKGPWSTWGMMRLIISFWVFLNAVIMLGLGIKFAANLGVSGADLTSLIMVNLVMFAYAAYATAATRGSLREKYHIREHRFIDVEDYVCATCCMPCTICQMGRHTVSYNEYQGACCTKNGIRDIVSNGPATSVGRETELPTRWS
mmetsp:Transcript_14710/g.23170  ORF Transcript_14710/g.23170 Transcript_14710/m.23170 type:complete len:627 (-) Transcript_14710:74-1954(-)